LLQVEIFYDVHAQPVEHSLMHRIAGNPFRLSPPRPGAPVDIEIVTDERDIPLLDPGNDVRKITRHYARLRTFRSSSFPAADVEQNHVAWSGLDSGFFIPRF